VEICREIRADDGFPSFCEDCRASTRIQSLISKPLVIRVVLESLLVAGKTGLEISADLWESLLEKAHHVFVGNESAANVLIAEAIDGFDASQLWLRRRVEVLEVSLITDHAGLPEE